MCYVNSNFYEYTSVLLAINIRNVLLSSLLPRNSILYFTLSGTLDANEMTNYEQRLQSANADAYILYYDANCNNERNWTLYTQVLRIATHLIVLRDVKLKNCKAKVAMLQSVSCRVTDLIGRWINVLQSQDIILMLMAWNTSRDLLYLPNVTPNTLLSILFLCVRLNCP